MRPHPLLATVNNCCTRKQLLYLCPLLLAAEEQGFMNMYPHQGAWGLWYLPGEARLHPLSSRSVTSQRATGLHPVQDCT